MAEERRQRDVHRHAGTGRVAELLAELEREPALLEARDRSGGTPLHYAVSHGHAECVELLLARGACANAEDDYRRPPLHFAADHGHLETIRLLVAAGANLFRRDTDGRTPLDCARRSVWHNLAEYLEGEMRRVRAAVVQATSAKRVSPQHVMLPELAAIVADYVIPAE